MAEGAMDDATFDAYAHRADAARARRRLQLARVGQLDAARARVPRRAPRPLAGDVLRRRAHPRVAGARAGGRSRPAAARRADQPPRHRSRSSGWRRTCSRSTPRSSWWRTTAGSSRRSARRCSSSRAGARSSSRAPGTRGAPRRRSASWRSAARSRSSRPRSPSSSASSPASARARARARRRRAQKKLDKIDQLTTRPEGRQGARLRVQAAGALRPRRLRGRGRAAEDRRPRRCCRTPSCGSSAASTSRWSAPTAPARRR